MPRLKSRDVLPPMTEKAFQAQVKRLADLFHWLYFHPFWSVRSTPGFPDCTLVRPPRLIFAELKREGENPTAAQQQWLEALVRCISPQSNLEVYVWRPSDLPEIARILR